MRKYIFPIIVLLLWISMIVIFYACLNQTGQSVEEFTFSLYILIKQNLYLGAVFFIALYLLRPLFFIPASPFIIFAGVLFWFFWGIIICTIANMLSTVFSYYVGYITGGKMLGSSRWFHRIEQLQSKLRKNTFVSVAMMRLLSFPFDLTNYICWILKIPLIPYVAATVAWVPSTSTFVLAGAAFYGQEISSFSDLTQGINYTYLYIAIIFFILIIIFSQILKKYSKF